MLIDLGSWLYFMVGFYTLVLILLSLTIFGTVRWIQRYIHRRKEETLIREEKDFCWVHLRPNVSRR